MTGHRPDTNVRPPVGVNLDAEISRLGLTNDEVARRLVIPERQVRRWRKSQTTPEWPAVVLLAELFDRSPSWFYADHASDEAAA